MRRKSAKHSEDLCVKTSRFLLTSPSVGQLELLVSELPLFDAAHGGIDGSLVEFRPVESQWPQRFLDAVCARQNHAILWEVYASSYDSILPRLDFYQRTIERHESALRSPDVQSILDVGAGTGNLSLRLVATEKVVTAVEIGRPMLTRLKQKAADRSLNIRSFEASALDMSFLNNLEFDAVTVLLAFFDMQDPYRALAECHRCLRSGGLFVATEPKKSFNVDQLMTAAESSLRLESDSKSLLQHWKRIQSVAPLIGDKIAGQNQREWNAERLVDELKVMNYRIESIVDSHLGNCATVCARRP